MKRICLLFITTFLLTFVYAQKKRTSVYHRGFYISADIGPSFGDINATKGTTRVINVKGNVLGMDVQIGNAIQPNLILHGTVKVQTVISPKVNSLQFPDSYSFDENFVGAGITKYNSSNFFGTANLGMALYTFSRPTTSFQSANVSTDPGFSFNIKLGKEWVVSEKWGLGGVLFFSRTALTNQDYSSTEKWSSNRFGICIHATFNKTSGDK